LENPEQEVLEKFHENMKSIRSFFQLKFKRTEDKNNFSENQQKIVQDSKKNKMTSIIQSQYLFLTS
jgi:hypothetical protein